MILEPIHREDREAAVSLYRSSFPDRERADVDRLFSHLVRGDAEWLGIYDPDLRGMVYALYSGRMAFLLYLAVAPEHRGSGLGSQALEAFRLRYPYRKLFLNIEPPDEDVPDKEVRLRRQAFYVRNGFIPCGRLRSAEGDYITMCYMGRITPEEFSAFRIEVGLDLLFDGGAVLETVRDVDLVCGRGTRRCRSPSSRPTRTRRWSR